MPFRTWMDVRPLVMVVVACIGHVDVADPVLHGHRQVLPVVIHHTLQHHVHLVGVMVMAMWMVMAMATMVIMVMRVMATMVMAMMSMMMAVHPPPCRRSR